MSIFFFVVLFIPFFRKYPNWISQCLKFKMHKLALIVVFFFWIKLGIDVPTDHNRYEKKKIRFRFLLNSQIFLQFRNNPFNDEIHKNFHNSFTSRNEWNFFLFLLFLSFVTILCLGISSVPNNLLSICWFFFPSFYYSKEEKK